MTTSPDYLVAIARAVRLENFTQAVYLVAALVDQLYFPKSKSLCTNQPLLVSRLCYISHHLQHLVPSTVAISRAPPRLSILLPLWL